MEARQPFSRLGWALFAQMAVMLAAQWGVLLLARAARPGLLGEPVFLWAASVLGAYGLGIPAACLVLWGTAAPPAPARRPLGPVRFAALWAGSVGLAYLANGATLLLTGLLGRLRGAAVVNPVESIGLYPLPLQLLLAGLIAPAAEELLFRRLLLRRLRPYGERFALVASALCFGLFHGNLNQFFYAFLLGLAGRPGGGDGCADAGRRHGAVPADPRASGPSGRRARNMAALSHQPRRALLRRAVPVPGAVLFDLKGWSVLW